MRSKPKKARLCPVCGSPMKKNGKPDNPYDTGIQDNNHDDPSSEPGFYNRKGHVH
ncbi:hypothetical protein [Bifidobacterium panos]|nr:hypothetical protein [Bifidobacterium sp. DSM 109963]